MSSLDKTFFKKISNNVARCRFWKAIIFELLDKDFSNLLALSWMLYTGILNVSVKNSMQLLGIRYFVVCRNTTLNHFAFVTIMSPV